MENIILIGFMGTGKTTVGKSLAVAYPFWTFVDLDQQIEKEAGKPIPDLFRENGEPYFREVESRVLRDTLQKNGQIIATGGGIVLRPQNVEMMLAGGVVVALRADEEEIIRRVARSTNRPLLEGDPAARVRTLMEQRAGKYDFAPVQIDTTGKTVAAIVQEIAARVIEP